jgi:hypothetical protein
VRQTFNPLVQGSNPWGATTENHGIMPRGTVPHSSFPGRRPSLTSIYDDNRYLTILLPRARERNG